ncbi:MULTISPECIES: hypothetical protein [Burkholderiaceae]|uniref:hypothetical protein n=1 Tax=Burkholderiaceae TaxID=119060 RepID=UPI000A8989EF|nr:MULTISPECIES: hypothetical protein [Burkholderiaceae]
MKLKLESLLNKLATARNLPKKGVGSVYLTNMPQHGGYAVWEVTSESGGVDSWNEPRLKPRMMEAFLLRLINQEANKEQD